MEMGVVRSLLGHGGISRERILAVMALLYPLLLHSLDTHPWLYSDLCQHKSWQRSEYTHKKPWCGGIRYVKVYFIYLSATTWSLPTGRLQQSLCQSVVTCMQALVRMCCKLLKRRM